MIVFIYLLSVFFCFFVCLFACFCDYTVGCTATETAEITVIKQKKLNFILECLKYSTAYIQQSK